VENRVVRRTIFLDTIAALHHIAGEESIGAPSNKSRKARNMATGFESIQTLSKDNTDAVLKSANAVSRGFQAIAAEAADYSKRTIDAGTSALERLIGAGSLDKAVEVQSDYVRTAYEGYVAQVAKVSEIVTDMTKGAYEPYEAMFGKFGR
jgi:hypothetical protein